DRRNAAGVHQTLDTGRATGLKEISGPDNVAVVDVARITCPKPIIRGHVKHLINTADNWRDRRGVAEISVHDLQGKVPNGGETAGRANKRPDLSALFDQQTCEMTSDEPSRARDERRHQAVLAAPSG